MMNWLLEFLGLLWGPEFAKQLNDQTDVGEDQILPNVVDVVGATPPQPDHSEPADRFYYQYPSKSSDGRFMPVTWVGTTAPAQRGLTNQNIRELAAEYKVPFCHLKAVLAVESAGSGFLLREPHPARPKILFEAHKFYKHSGSVPVSKTRPDLSQPRWTKKYYKGGSAEWGRLEDAMRFHEEGALKSASWGLAQILGVNHKAAGCDTIQDFIVETFTGEKQQLQHMINFIKNNGLLPALRSGDWHTFARGYNGPSYRKNAYHTKLAAAAKRCA
jgi:hypothetical protein